MSDQQQPEDPDMKRLREAAEDLGEYFDSCQIFCTRHESEIEKGTIRVAYGVGNFLARYGMAELWVARQKAIELDDIMRQDKGDD